MFFCFIVFVYSPPLFLLSSKEMNELGWKKEKHFHRSCTTLLLEQWNGARLEFSLRWSPRRF
jgi:hypothetical protein